MTARVLARWSLEGTDWMPMVLALLALAVGLLVWAYPGRSGKAVKPAAFYLKLLCFLILGFFLLEPQWHFRRPRPQANELVVLVDGSRSLQIRDQDGTERGTFLKQQLVNAETSWLGALQEQFQVRKYVFTDRLKRIDSFQDLTFEGPSSDLHSALKEISERYRGRPLAGILLLSDGNATDLPPRVTDRLPLPPVHAVLIGADRPRQSDLAVTAVNSSLATFEDAPVNLSVQIRCSGYTGRRAILKLEEESGRLVEQRLIDVPSAAFDQTLRFRIKPQEPHTAIYRIRLSEEAGTETTALPEATLDNNERLVAIERAAGPYRMLYVSGRPNWDFKFLRRAVEEDPTLQLVSLIRIARREPRFEWKGRNGEEANPLFRGFDQKPEDEQRYDKPILIRQGVRDAEELKAGFPTQPQDLFPYEALILDDLEAEFMTGEQMGLVQRYVSERGGSLLMLGGADSFSEGGWNGTPVGQMLPIFLEKSPQPAGAREVRWSLTREGWMEPFLRLRDNEEDENKRLTEMAAFRVLHTGAGLKPAARTLSAAESGAAGSQPLLCWHPFGRGRVAALTLGDLWRWGMKNPQAGADLAKSWRQMLRWLINDVPGAIEMEITRTPGENRRLRVLVRDPAFNPKEDAHVKLHLSPPGTASAEMPTLTALPTLQTPGTFETTCASSTPGAYRIKAEVRDPAGQLLGELERAWVVEPHVQEMAAVEPDRAALQEIAMASGGALLGSGEAHRWAAALDQIEAPITEWRQTPLWHGLLPVLMVLTLMVGEWSLRRWRGLP